MIELPARTRRVSGTRLLDLCRERDIASLVDPFMGLPTHLNVLKRHGIAVHGGDLLEWFVRAGEGLVVNDFTILRENEVAEVVEMLPGRIYPTDLFRAWEGVFFSEEQCRYLGVWHANVHALRSDGQTGLAVLGLWHVLCHWLLKARHPDEMVDVAPSELAWTYIRETERWVADNGKRNTVRRGDFATTLAQCESRCGVLGAAWAQRCEADRRAGVDVGSLVARRSVPERRAAVPRYGVRERRPTTTPATTAPSPTCWKLLALRAM